MTPEIERMLQIDFSVCEQLLIGAGIKSLGKNNRKIPTPQSLYNTIPNRNHVS